MAIRTVGVIGAGVMGVGVAQNLAQAKCQVIHVDHTDEVLAQARTKIMNNLRLQRMLDRTSSSESVEQIMERIAFTTNYTLFTDVDFVIENVTEKWESKKDIYPQIDAL